MTHNTATSTPAASTLRNLYFTRTAFQLAWAASVFATAATNPALAAVLFVAYPLWDVACTLYDLTLPGKTGTVKSSLVVNAVLGIAAAVAIAVNVHQAPTHAVAAFGFWALAAGLLQLAVGLVRRKQLGGQWAMILSGAQSSLGGTFYVLGGLAGKRHLADIPGYATFGAVYFLISAVLLLRSERLQPDRTLAQ
jgi:hypothetical protein